MMVIRLHNVFYPFASIGGAPQDKKYQGEDTILIIGDRNTIRENTTLNRGTVQGGGVTKIGHDNWIMANVHIAHDCVVGDHTIFANCAALAGHVKVENYAIISGFSAVHQFCVIGAHSFIARATYVTKDVIPYVMIAGYDAAACGLNVEGLKRRNFSSATFEKALATLKDPNDALVHTNNDGESILHTAAFYGKSDILKYVYMNYETSYQILLLRINRDQDTPLHLAAQEGHEAAVTILLTSEQSSITRANSSLLMKNIDGDTPLHLAAYHGRVGVIRQMCTSAKSEFLQALKKTENEGNMPLHLAVVSGDEDTVNFLITRQADCSAVNAGGNLPLHLAAIYGNKNIIKAIREALSVSSSFSQPAELTKHNNHGLIRFNFLVLILVVSCVS